VTGGADVGTVTPDAATTTGTPSSSSLLTGRLFLASVVAAVVPVVVATVRALNRGWIPVGDDGLFQIRSLDVFGHHVPLLGTWSSGSVSAHIDLNHPGPLMFDLLAVPVQLLGGAAGVAVGVALINVLAIIGIAVFAHRRGGPLLGAVSMAVVAALAWAMGSELLFEPWPPHSLLIPFLFFLVLVWSMTCGDLVAIPFAAGVASLLLQTHLSYAALVPALLGWGVIGLVLTLRRQLRSGADDAPERPRLTRAVGVSAVVLVICWIQPLVEQFTSGGPGNLTRLVRTARDAHLQTIGWRTGTLIVASVSALPPWWFRPSVDHTFFVGSRGWTPPSLGLAVVALAVLVGVLAGCWWDARRRSDRAAVLGVVTAAVALPVALATAAQSPVNVFGPYTPHQWRWLWPLAAFVFFAILVAVVRRLDLTRRTASLALVVGFTVVVVVLSALNLPFANLADGPNSQEWAIGPAQQLNDQLGRLAHRGPLLVDDLFRSFASPYNTTVLAALQDRDITFVAHDESLVRQLGPARRYNGRNARFELLLRTGDGALRAPAGSSRVAFAEGMSARDRRDLGRVTAEVSSYIRQHGLRLTLAGLAALRRGDLPNLARLAPGGGDPMPLIQSRELVAIVNLHYLMLDPSWAARFDRYAALQQEFDRETVALFVRPITPVRTTAFGG